LTVIYNLGLYFRALAHFLKRATGVTNAGRFVPVDGGWAETYKTHFAWQIGAKRARVQGTRNGYAIR
jgi:hypothetical protein